MCLARLCCGELFFGDDDANLTRCCGLYALCTLYDFRHTADEISFEDTPQLRKVINHWKLTIREQIWFYKVFRKTNTSKSGTVEYEEFFAQLQGYTRLLEDQPRLKNFLFEFIVERGKPHVELNFTNWMIVIFSFCFTTNKEILELAYAFYNFEIDGQLNATELEELVVSIHPSVADHSLQYGTLKDEPNRLMKCLGCICICCATLEDAMPFFPQEILTSLNSEIHDTNVLDFDAFELACEKYPMILYPILKIREIMRKKYFGNNIYSILEGKYWRKCFTMCYKNKTFFDDLDSRTHDILYLDPLENKVVKNRREQIKKNLEIYLTGWCCCDYGREMQAHRDEEDQTGIDELESISTDLESWTSENEFTDSEGLSE